MSQPLPPNDQHFVPPPPPTSNSIYPPDVLARQAAIVASNAKTALILSIIGFFCAGFILGYLAFRKANEALEIIQIYDVAHDKKGLAMTAKILSIVDIVGWIFMLILRFTLA
ncbi:MAG TPA: hypothetical protein VJT50_04720 [Pyrinomonadaceae bacterium]|nr:hypothetical protein [Pyrinomonadaceae bacterium]